jgi:hypothetical protein
MTTFTGPLTVRKTWQVEGSGVSFTGDTIVAASVSAASSAATTTYVPRGFLKVTVDGVIKAVPYYNFDS